MTKKSHQKFWEIYEICWKVEQFLFGKRLKKVIKNFGKLLTLHFWSSWSASVCILSLFPQNVLIPPISPKFINSRLPSFVQFTVSLLNLRFLVSRYFHHDAFMHHALHLLVHIKSFYDPQMRRPNGWGRVERSIGSGTDKGKHRSKYDPPLAARRSMSSQNSAFTWCIHRISMIHVIQVEAFAIDHTTADR